MIFAPPYYLSRVKGYSQLLLCEAPNRRALIHSKPTHPQLCQGVKKTGPDTARQSPTIGRGQGNSEVSTDRPTDRTVQGRVYVTKDVMLQSPPPLPNRTNHRRCRSRPNQSYPPAVNAWCLNRYGPIRQGDDTSRDGPIRQGDEDSNTISPSPTR